MNFFNYQAVEVTVPMGVNLSIKRWVLVCMSACVCLSGCALALEYPLTSASLGVWGATGKSPSDHAISYVTDEDCEAMRLMKSDPMCKKLNQGPIEVVDKSSYINR
jgi:hypothetical protein